VSLNSQVYFLKNIIKLKNNKKNHKNCQNQSPTMRFFISKDLMVCIALPWIL
jgi:hypothetical protein